jgi:cytosine/adenosine deaminase-related metal-dependent hydrolase
VALRLISAPWVVPILGPPIREGAVALDDASDPRDANDPNDPNDPNHPSNANAVKGGSTIVSVGARADIRRDHPAAHEMRAEGALFPGVVNAHTHLELSACAGCITGGDGVVNWTRRLAARLAGQDLATTAAAAIAAARSAKAFGTVAMADVGNGTSGWRALARAGLGGVFFHELVGSREARTGDALGDAATERAAVPEIDRPKGVPVVPAPHAPYSVGPALMRRIFVAAAATGHATTIHLAEDWDEIALLRTGGGAWPDILRKMNVSPEEDEAREQRGARAPGLGPTAYLDRLGAFAGPHPPLLVHMVHADDDDRRRARVAGATVVLCPRSNLHIGGRLPDVTALIAEGVRLAIGTDSLASTPDLSPWAEIATLVAHCPDVPPRAWLAAATIGGASAMGLGTLGAIAPGYCPGLLDVELGSTGDPERALVTNPNPRVRWMASA